MRRDSAAYYTTTPASTSGRRRRRPSRSARSSRNVVSYGQRARLRGTNMRYVTITKSQLVQQRRRHRPERAGLARSSRRRRTTSSPTTTSSGTTSTTTRAPPFKLRQAATATLATRSASASCCSAAAATRSRTTASTATTCRRGAIEAFLLDKNPDAATLVGNQIRDNRSASTAPTSTAATSATTATARATACRATPAWTRSCPRTASTLVPCPFGGANAFNESARNTAVGWAIAPDQSVNYVRHDHAAQGPLSGLLAKYGPIKPLENFSSDAWGQ